MIDQEILRLQPDNNSCGVFTCLKAEEIGTGSNLLSCLKTVAQKRKYLVQNALLNADDIHVNAADVLSKLPL